MSITSKGFWFISRADKLEASCASKSYFYGVYLANDVLRAAHSYRTVTGSDPFLNNEATLIYKTLWFILITIWKKQSFGQFTSLTKSQFFNAEVLRISFTWFRLTFYVLCIYVYGSRTYQVEASRPSLIYKTIRSSLHLIKSKFSLSIVLPPFISCR